MEEKTYFTQIHKCAQQIVARTYVAPMDEDFYWKNTIPKSCDKLLCHLKSTHSLLEDTLKRYRNILFIGDSLVRHQFFTMVCMLDPNAAPQHFTKYHEANGDGAEFHFVYNHSTTTNTANTNMTNATTVTNLTTSLHYASYGPSFNRKMRHLYKDAFPWAIGNYTQEDAIVTDTSRHFPSKDIGLYTNVLDYLQDQSINSSASFYYMEPTPEEWATSNGIWAKPCGWKCTCRPLDEPKLKGWATPNDPNVDLARNDTKGAHLYVPSFDHFIKLYPNQNRTRAFTTHMDPANVTCLPDCAPADWRVRSVRSKILHHPNPKTKFQLVPTYWQLVGRSHHSSATLKGDCTHRSLDAYVMMNEQLIRTMMHSKTKLKGRE